MSDWQHASRIAVIGGTFDPIHHGHLAAAESARQALGAEHVLFIPAARPPHKDISSVTFSEYRYLMTALAVYSNPFFSVSRIEIDREGASYTIDTLKALRGMLPEKTQLFFIIGADELPHISHWKDAAELLKICKWGICTRGGYDTQKIYPNPREDMNGISFPPVSIAEYPEYLRTHFGFEYEWLKIPALEISGTEIRKRVFDKMSVKYLIPDSVEMFVRDFNLYASAAENEQLAHEKMQKAVFSRLSPKRYAHTAGVVETAVRLAARYGTDIKKAYIAALLHDYSKEYSEDKKRELCRVYGISVDKIQNQYINLIHGHLAAEEAAREWGIKDQEILEAVRWHTTGRARMGMLEKIIKIADYIEPNRTPIEGLEEVRALSETDINRALIVSIAQSIQHNKKKGRIIHPLSGEALRDLEESHWKRQ